MPGIDDAAATGSSITLIRHAGHSAERSDSERSAINARLRALGASDVIWMSVSLKDIDVYGIAQLIITKVLCWRREQNVPR